MKTVSTWPEVRERLGARGLGAQPCPTDAFWHDFHARVTLYPQREGAARAAQPRRWPWLVGSAAAAACGVVVAILSGQPAGASPSGVGVRSYQVLAPHEAVMLLHDADTDATILWVSGVPDATGREP